MVPIYENTTHLRLHERACFYKITVDAHLTDPRIPVRINEEQHANENRLLSLLNSLHHYNGLHNSLITQ